MINHREDCQTMSSKCQHKQKHSASPSANFEMHATGEMSPCQDLQQESQLHVQAGGSRSLHWKICTSPEVWSLDEGFTEWELVIGGAGQRQEDRMARGNMEQRHGNSVKALAKSAKQVRHSEA